MGKSLSNESLDGSVGDIDLKELIFNYLQYRKWVTVSIVFFLSVGVLVYMCMDRKYQITSSILLKQDNGSMTSSNSPLGQLEGLGLISTTSNVDNEIAVLSSPNLMRQITLSLGLYTSYYKKGLLRDEEVYKDCPYIVRLDNGDIEAFEGDIVLRISPLDNGVQIKGTYKVDRDKANDIDIDQTVERLPGSIDFPKGLGKLYIGRNDLEKTSDDKDSDYSVHISSVRRVTSFFVKSLNVTPVTKNASVLDMNLDVENVQKGIDILTEIVKVYNLNNVKDNNEISLNTSRFVKGRLDSLEVELKQVENQVVDFKKAQGITDISSETKLYLEQTGLLDQKRLDVETQVRVIELVENYIKNPANKSKLIPSLGVTDPGLTSVIGDYNSVLLDYESLERSASVDNPRRVRTLADLTAMREAIQASIDNVKKAMNISKKQLDNQLSGISSRVNSVPSQERGLLEIMRQQQTKQALFLYLMQIGEQTNITMASTSDKAKVITDPIIPDGPVSPKRNIILLASFLLGLMFPLGIIYVKDLFQTNIQTREELEKLSNVNVIGEIIKLEESARTNNVIVVGHDKTTPIAELFRSVRNNLKFTLGSEDKKVVLVTSTVPGEGKTFVSINVAASFSLSEKKVLLIGVDIRNPKLAADIGFRKGAGLTSYLSRSETDWRSLLIALKGFPNLDILQAGAIPPNPNELLMSPQLSILLKEARNLYDVIIMDSAPIGVVSDTFLLSSLCDVTLYVAREKVTPKNAITFINEVSHDKKLPNMYVLINAVAPTKNKGRHGRYGYGYTYGYGERK